MSDPMQSVINPAAALFRPPAAPAAPKIFSPEERIGTAEKLIEQSRKQESEAALALGKRQQEEAVFKTEQEAKLAKGEAELERKAKEGIEGSEAYQLQQDIEKEIAQARFAPTQRTAQENMMMMALINLVGFGIGAGGKGNSMAALGAMTGMLDGVQKGDMARYKQEREKFDSNLKALHERAVRVDTLLKRVADLQTRDKNAAMLELRAGLAQEGADWLRQYGDKFGLVKQQELSAQIRRDAEKMRDTAQKAKDAEDRARENRLAQVQREQERFQGLRALQEQRLEAQRQNTLTRLQSQVELTKMRADLAEERSKAKGEAKGKLMDKDVRQLEAYDSISQGLDELRRTFKPEYASFGVLGFGADISAEAKRRLGEKEGVEAMRWWSRYEQLQAPNRHALFGATLTGNELKNYQSFTAKKSDSPEFVVASLGDQIEYSRGQAELKRNLFREANKEVPSYPTRNYFGTYSGPAQPPAAAPATTTATSRQLSPQDQQALDWANSNPNDPRSTQIKQRLGVQ